MGLQDLISRLERDAERRIAELRDKAQAEAEGLLAEAARESAAHRERELGLRRGARKGRYERALAEARQRARADRLRAQHELLARIFTRARELIPEVAASDAYAAALGAHLAEALRYVEGTRAVVRCAPAHLAVVQPLLAARDGVELVEDPSLAPGVVVTTADESVAIDDTLPARLARFEPRLSVELIAEVTS